MLEYRIDKEQRVIFVGFSAKLTDDDITSRFEELLGNPDFNCPLRILADTRGLTGVDVSTPTIVSLAERMRGDDRFQRIAVISENLVIIGLARMLTLLDENREMQTFATEAEAWAWLG